MYSLALTFNNVNLSLSNNDNNSLVSIATLAQMLNTNIESIMYYCKMLKIQVEQAFTLNQCYDIAHHLDTKLSREFIEAIEPFVQQKNNERIEFVKDIDASYERLQSLLGVMLNGTEKHSTIYNLLMIARENVELWQDRCIDEIRVCS